MRKRDKVLEESMEKNNNFKINVLYTQVQEIRNSAENIHEDLKASNGFLDGLHSAFDKGKGSVTGVYGKFENMLQQKNNRLSIYIAGILTVLFIIGWKAFQMRETGENS
jgi:hypothetical protein